MRLAQALLERSNLSKKISELKNRITEVGKTQEGDSPQESPDELLTTLNSVYNQLHNLERRILKTNYMTQVTLDDTKETLTIVELLKLKDQCNNHVDALQKCVESCSVRPDRFSRNEIKFVCHLDVKNVRQLIEFLVSKRKNYELKVQEVNWTVELLD